MENWTVVRAIISINGLDFFSEGVDIPDDCPLTLPTNPSLYRQLVQYFRQYFGTPQVEVGEETEEETISFIMEG